jgi:hypothetical protein
VGRWPIQALADGELLSPPASQTGNLMVPGAGEPEPEGGQFNFDHDNREPRPKTGHLGC